MQVILLSGGSGKRLWPLSNDVRSKQFIKIFKREDGQYESMVQRVYRQILAVDPDAAVTIATGRAQVSAIQNQLGLDTVGISTEPCRRDTFPAIALSAAWLCDVKGVSPDETVVVCPVDPYVGEDYFMAVRRLSSLASEGRTELMLMGMEPTSPSEHYGYIIPADKSETSRVKSFREKPSEEKAKEYIADGALWNGGVFAFRLGYVLAKARELLGSDSYQDLFSRYESFEPISFDRAVAEKESDAMVLRFSGMWKDIGSWSTLTEAMDESTMGKAILAEGCEDVSVVNELNVPVLCVGLKNLVVSASAEGILVSDRELSGCIKPYVDGIDQQVMFAEKSWGSYNVIDVQPGSMTIRVNLNAGHSMNYHSHEHRNEVWTLLSGTGRTVVDGMQQQVKVGDVITIMAGCRHTIIADTDLSLIEVQLGENISVHDKKKHEL